MKLSENFTLTELCKSQTADRKGIVNAPNSDAIFALQLLCDNVLQPVRNQFLIPYTPSSGYRCVELCEAIGSSALSQHAKGEAADFEVPTIPNIEVAQWIASHLIFDQLILEYYSGGNTGWIHCSYTEFNNRREILTLNEQYGYRVGLHN
tara:strand:- start:1745 stop:2194 length:450 start_codon:yes stop_codon:yes gene_type:complete